MRKLVVSEYMTLDGVMEDPGGGEKGGHGGWSHQFWSDEAGKFKYEELFAADALLLGRVTYQGFAKAWPTMKNTGDFGERMNALPKYVVTSTLDTLEWNNSHLIKGDIAGAVSNLKQQPGQDILVAGSAQLVGLLMQHNLVDEYRLMLHPIVVGGGKRLFPGGDERKVMKLASSAPFSAGIVLLTYHAAGQ